MSSASLHNETPNLLKNSSYSRLIPLARSLRFTQDKSK